MTKQRCVVCIELRHNTFEMSLKYTVEKFCEPHFWVWREDSERITILSEGRVPTLLSASVTPDGNFVFRTKQELSR